jgi:hypothetical protein
VPGFAAAVTCIDGRFHAALVAWITRELDVEHVDLITAPGVSSSLAAAEEKATREVVDHLAPSLGAHGSEVVVVAAHHGCAADPSDDATQVSALPAAAAHLRAALHRRSGVGSADPHVLAVHLGADGHVEVVGSPVGQARSAAPNAVLNRRHQITTVS